MMEQEATEAPVEAATQEAGANDQGGAELTVQDLASLKQIIDVANLPPNLYIIRIGEELFKFIKM